MPLTAEFTPLASPFSPWEPGALPLVVYGGIVLAVLAVILFLSGFLVRRRPTPVKQQPYECGIRPTGPARFRYPVPFFLVAVLFLLFDVEIVFMFPWAIDFKLLGWFGFAEMMMFILLLAIGFVYAWKKGALEWHNIK